MIYFRYNYGHYNQKIAIFATIALAKFGKLLKKSYDEFLRTFSRIQTKI
ncbi:hypothetical protein HFN_0957 [Helicobacter fennelliae MRY12-0050]|uniref:Uncharacterized protein n=1 Tax=Helicobacter fennelliae MRY12-0050 TaxID=1325130 RepID=T1DWU5_9HELI|nr:hypothetical protein HFN_0957 [Helicobacter fennelliae MRY12-0050]